MLGLGTRRAAAQRGLAQRALGQAGRRTCARRSATSGCSGRPAPPATQIASTASTSRCASAATSARSPVPRTDIPVYLAAMGPADDPARRRDRRRLDQPRAVLAALPRASGSCPSSTAGIARAPGKTRADLDVVVSACCSVDRRPRRRAAPRRPGSSASTRRCAPTPTSSTSTASASRPAGGHRGVPRPAAAPDDLADTRQRDEMVDALTLTGTRDDVVGPDRGVRRPRRLGQAHARPPTASPPPRRGRHRRRSSR